MKKGEHARCMKTTPAAAIDDAYAKQNINIIARQGTTWCCLGNQEL
jgi:hypothetical protein